MPRFNPSGPLDTQGADDGDHGESSYNLVAGIISIPAFKGIYPKGEPEALPRGYAQSATNATFRDGTARTRLGSQTPLAMQPPGNPQLFGSGVFSDPNSTKYLLLAEATGVWRLRDGYTPRKIPIPSALAAACKIEQTFTSVILYRGSAFTPWAWDGDPATAFEPIDQSENADGTSPIPNGPDLLGLDPICLSDRNIVPYGRTSAAISEINDFTRYDASFDDFNFTPGDASVLTGLFPYETGLIIFCDRSLALLSNLSGDLSALTLGPRKSSVGCIAGRTAQQLGLDVVFLAQDGVYQLSNILQVQQTPAIPLSDPIEPLIDQINFPMAGGACGDTLREYYYLCVPFGGSAVNNAILPWNSSRGAWEGVHTFPAGVQFDRLHRLDYLGKTCLHGVDYTHGRVYLLYTGRYDNANGTRSAIPMSLTTRNYQLSTPDRKRFRRLHVFFKTFSPSYSISVATSGVNETTMLASAQTRDNTQYKIFGPAPYDPSNVNGDFAAPFREDYSINPDQAGFDPDASGGMDFDLEQEDRVACVTSRRGRSASVTISNTDGTMAVHSVILEGEPSEETDRPTA